MQFIFVTVITRGTISSIAMSLNQSGFSIMRLHSKGVVSSLYFKTILYCYNLCRSSYWAR